MSSQAPTKQLTPTNTSPSGYGIPQWIQQVGATTVGSKLVVALTGTLLTGFVIAHLVGNLKLFGGPDSINSYALFLKSLGPLLWLARLGLLAIFILHLYLALKLAFRAKAARPVKYQYERTIQASLASRTMPYTGVVILLFVMFHLAHFTFGWTNTTTAYDLKTGAVVENANYLSLVDSQGRHDVYSMVVTGFRNPLLAILYIVAQLGLLVHLSHGIGSVFQTFGLNSPRLQKFWRMVSWGLAAFIALGNIAIVLAVLTGLVPPLEKVYTNVG